MQEPHPRPDFLKVAATRLSTTELRQIRFIRGTYESPRTDKILRLLQRTLGTWWIDVCTRKLRSVHGFERLPKLDLAQSYVFVCNHRSFFDLYVITMELFTRGMLHRIIFPVRANFFYDSYVGLFVNGAMSLFAMYPPIFRERRKAFVNAASLQELVRLIRQGGFFVGIHPEGTRNTSDDPLDLLPAQPGVGKIIREAEVPVIPVFINGLLPHDFTRQVLSNFDGSGQPINIVFGSPIDFSEEFKRKGSPRLYKAISERCMEEIAKLGREEQELRAASKKGSAIAEGLKP
jgi:1-acyl-sn-glycerol-3-phosphate acyltransferase